MSELLRRLRVLFRRDRLDRDLEDEMRSHLEMSVEENRENGMRPGEARYAAQRRFGNPTLLKETSREMWGWRVVEEFARDVRFALRMLRKNPGFTAVAVSILALGIGANTTVYSVLNAALLRDLPVSDPARLASFLPERLASYPDYLDFRAQTSSFDDVCAFYPNARATLSGGDRPERVVGEVVTANYFSVTGVRPILGRGFVPEEDRTPSPVVVLSHALWRRSLGGDRGILGKKVLLNNGGYTVIGVGPEGFQGTRRGLAADFWVPVSMAEQILPWAAKARLLATRDQRGFVLLGRLKRGVTPERATADVNVVKDRIVRLTGMRLTEKVALAVAGSTTDQRGRQFIGWTSVLMAAVAVLLLIACANVAGLQLASATARSREIGIRLAVGAGRGHVFRQLLTENVLLAGMGAVAGYALAVVATRALSRIELPLRETITLDISPDGRVLLFAAVVAMLAAMAFGLMPALRATRQDPMRSLKGVSGRSVASFGPRSVLVTAQAALSVVLVVGAGLFLRSLWKLLAIDPGFRPEKVLLLNLDPRFQGYSEEAAMNLFRSIEARLTALPGVRSMSFVSIPPLSMYTSGRGFKVDRQGDDKTRQLNVVVVSAGYFETLGIPVLQGRSFDRTNRDPQAVISEAAARLFFQGENPVGRRILTHNRKRAYEVIGVVPDAKIARITEEPAACMYQLLDQEPGSTAYGMSIMVRTAADPRAMIGPVRGEIAALDRGLALYGVETMSAHVRKTLVGARMSAILFGAFGGLGLVIAAVGLYGLMSYTVRRRTKEIAIRAALGASSLQLVREVVAQGMALVVLGVVAGLAGAWVTTRLVASFLYGVTDSDAVTFLAAPMVLCIAALAASYLPARRAAKIDPMEALRYE